MTKEKKRLKVFSKRKNSDLLSALNYGYSNDSTYDFVVIVPASSTIAFKECLTSCPQALSSAQSMPTFKILIEAFKSR